MSISKTSLMMIAAIVVCPTTASAQYYFPPQASVSDSHQPGGVGLDLGFRQGVYPSVGAGIGDVGVGIGAGGGEQGFGTGAALGAGPVGGAGTLGLGPQGLGAEGSLGWGTQTGAVFETGVSQRGLGLGGRAEFLGFGTGGSLGVDQRGPDLGVSVAFGQFGTLQLGSHALRPRVQNEGVAYPGFASGYEGLQPGQEVHYYQRRAYGQTPYYPPVIIPSDSHPCPPGWTCKR